jgi:hypothetical protein
MILAGAVLMAGCASEAMPGQGDRVASREDAPLGSLIKRKPGTSGPDNAGNADLQQLENARNNGSGTMNLPGGLGR